MASIKPKKVQVVLKKKADVAAPADGDSSWLTLRHFITGVQGARGGDIVRLAALSFSFEELYGTVTGACLQKRGDELYRLLREQCTEHARRLVEALHDAPEDARLYVQAVQSTWADFSAQMSLLRAVFSYLERAVVHGDGVSLSELGTRLFGDALVAAHAALGRTVSAVVSLTRAMRDGESIDRSCLSSVVRMLAQLGCVGRSTGLYASHLEPALLSTSDAYYQAEGAAEMERREPAQYCAHVDERLREETWKPLRALLHKRLISEHATLLIERGFVPLVAAGREGDLARMYALLAGVGRADDMRKAYSDHCKADAGAIVGKADDEERDKVLVQSLLDFRDSHDKLVASAFQGNEAFTAAVKGAVELAANSRENRPAELIAKFIDARLRTSGRADGGDSALDAVLERVMALFRVVHGKDVFEAFYKKDLAKRLLLGRSASTDSEKAMVARLKTECGSAFTSKLEGMFKDTELSAELNTQYVAHGGGGAGGGGQAHKSMDAYVHVLTASYWPSYAVEPVRLPAELRPPAEAFEAFYHAKYSGNRRLAWVPSLGHCILKATFPSGKKELDVSLFQAMVLRLYNVETSLPFLRIKEETGIPDGELRRTLQSLALAKERVLKKEPKGKDVLDGDVFTFNEAYTSNLVRVKINQIQMKETKAEADATTDRVIADRQYQVDAAIVRIMKSRKSLTHAALLTELFAHLRFSAKAADIKKRIESLIEREYLEREGGDTDAGTSYTYLA